MNLIKHQRWYIDKIYLYVKDPFEWKYELLTIRREKVGIKKKKNPKAFTDYSQTIGDVYQNLENCDPTKKKKVLAEFEDIIADLESD